MMSASVICLALASTLLNRNIFKHANQGSNWTCNRTNHGSKGEGLFANAPFEKQGKPGGKTGKGRRGWDSAHFPMRRWSSS